ncbi:hypothetical protein ANN_14716 [Periplaneta americana]|uniref:Uncharacterized protein n=1 Tax=Periplaneta americana TaxID=6978 RepID=A0ABQ8SZ71_PERAM|nr:hypothetical protein ANN_14716 [Periplaneta americana]
MDACQSENTELKYASRKMEHKLGSSDDNIFMNSIRYPIEQTRGVVVGSVKVSWALDRSRWSHFLATEVTRPYSIGLLCLGLLNSEVYKRKVKTREERLARILHACAQVKECPNELRSATQQQSARAAKCIEVDGELSEHVFFRPSRNAVQQDKTRVSVSDAAVVVVGLWCCGDLVRCDALRQWDLQADFGHCGTTERAVGLVFHTTLGGPSL